MAALRLKLPGLQLKVNTQRKGSPIVDHIEDLFAEAAMGAVGRIGEIQSLEVDLQLLGELVAGAEVDLRGGIDEGWLSTVCGIVLRLAEMIQILIAVVDRHTRLDAVLVVEGDEVGGIGQTRHGEARDA